MRRVIFLLATVLLVSCTGAGEARKMVATGALLEESGRSTMQITSPAFAHDAFIPSFYTCDGKHTSPQLHITDAPADAVSFALVLHDPDAPIAGGFLHWIVWNIPAATRTIPEGQMIAGAVNGLNGTGKPGYFGPCPPSGTHHYNFSLYALDTMLTLPESASLQELTAAMDGHVLATATMTGLYQRKK